MSILGKSRTGDAYHMTTFTNRFPENELKVTVVGESSVGKSSLSQRIAHDKFKVDMESTIGAAFFTFRHSHEETHYVFKLWDTAGQERFDALVPMYLKGSNIVLLVFDITNFHSFQRIKEKWYDRVIDRVPEATILLVGNKADLDDKKHVDSKIIQEFCNNTGIKYLECSAKDGRGMDETAKIFLDVAEKLIPKSDNVFTVEKTIENQNSCIGDVKCYPF